MISFEQLWNICEEYHKENTDLNMLMQELMLKINLYKAFNDKENKNIPPEELQKVKSRTLGEILLTITGLSLKDNVNVFEALVSALQFKSPNSKLD